MDLQDASSSSAGIGARVLEAQAANNAIVEQKMKFSDEDRKLINRFIEAADASLMAEILKRATESFAGRGSPVKAPSACL